MMRPLKLFEEIKSEHHSENPVVFRGRLARRVQQAGEKLTDFLGDLQQLALKAYPGESEGIRDQLVHRVRLELRKTIWDKDMNIRIL